MQVTAVLQLEAAHMAAALAALAAPVEEQVVVAVLEAAAVEHNYN
mgnify:CR=1 FL=1